MGFDDRYRNETPWNLVHIFWGDERYVGADDPLEQYPDDARETLLSLATDTLQANVHPVPTPVPTPAAAAEAYEAELRKYSERRRRCFDVTLLGIGRRDTLIAIPDSPAWKKRCAGYCPLLRRQLRRTGSRYARRTESKQEDTYFLAAGKDKRAILDAIRAEPDDKVERISGGANPSHGWTRDLVSRSSRGGIIQGALKRKSEQSFSFRSLVPQDRRFSTPSTTFACIFVPLTHLLLPTRLQIRAREDFLRAVSGHIGRTRMGSVAGCWAWRHPQSESLKNKFLGVWTVETRIFQDCCGNNAKFSV